MKCTYTCESGSPWKHMEAILALKLWFQHTVLIVTVVFVFVLVFVFYLCLCLCGSNFSLCWEQSVVIVSECFFPNGSFPRKVISQTERGAEQQMKIMLIGSLHHRIRRRMSFHQIICFSRSFSFRLKFSARLIDKKGLNLWTNLASCWMAHQTRFSAFEL